MYFKNQSKRLRSCGIICKRVKNDKLYFLMVKQWNDKWSFPKGMRSNEFEPPKDVAIREFYEEVGIDLNDYSIKLNERVKIWGNTYYILNTNINNVEKDIFEEFPYNKLDENIEINKTTQINNRYDIFNTMNNDTEIKCISWISLDIISKNVTEFNTDVRQVINSKNEKPFHKNILGENYIKFYFDNDKIEKII